MCVCASAAVQDGADRLAEAQRTIADTVASNREAFNITDQVSARGRRRSTRRRRPQVPPGRYRLLLIDDGVALVVLIQTRAVIS